MSHSHGTTTAYQRDKCRCEPCELAYLRYQKRWRLDRSRGIARTIPADVVRAHLHRLMGSGMTTGHIAAAAGLRSHRVVWRLLNGDRDFVQRRVAEPILAVAPETLPHRADPESEVFVPVEPTRRRIRALMALGWTHADMRAHSGVHTAVLLSSRSPRVTWRNHNRVVEMYDALSMTPGPSQRTASRAARLGYLPPLAWDDDSIDRADGWADAGGDPVDVDPVVVERLVASPDVIWRSIGATRQERIEAAERIPNRSDAERRLGLRAGRDFAVRGVA